MFKKINKIILDVYKDAYALCGENFDEILEKDRDFWFLHYYLSHEDLEEVLKKHLKYQREYVKNAVRANVYLGCVPSGVDFYYELTKEDEPSFFKASSRVKWIEFGDIGAYKSWYTFPEIGRSLLMSPFNLGFTWQTTDVLEYTMEGADIVRFKTKNSNYILTRKLKNG